MACLVAEAKSERLYLGLDLVKVPLLITIKIVKEIYI